MLLLKAQPFLPFFVFFSIKPRRRAKIFQTTGRLELEAGKHKYPDGIVRYG